MHIKSSILFFIIMFSYASVPASSLVFPPYGHSYGIRKATQFHLFMFLPLTQFDDPQGLATAKMNARDDSTTEHDDDEVVVYGVNSGQHQLIYNTSMWRLAVYGKKGSGKDQFLFPKGIACDPKGNVYVVDAGNNRVVRLFNPKRRVQWVSAFDGGGNGGKKLFAPMQVALDEQGRVYVTDTGNRRIVVFDSIGTMLLTIGEKDSSLFSDGPTTLAVADGKYHWSFYHHEQAIFCADQGGRRLWKMDFNGNVIKTAVMPQGYNAFYGAIDYYHNFYVTDKNKHCIVKFDHNLQMVDKFGSWGKGDNQFLEPRGIAIWKRYGQTFIAEQSGAQYYWVGTECTGLGLWQQKPNQYTLKVTAPEYSFISLHRILGSDTTEMFRRRFMLPGPQSYTLYDTLLSKPGKGTLVFRIEPTYSSHTYFRWEYPVKAYPDEASVPGGRPQGTFVKLRKETEKKKGIDELLKEAKNHREDD